MWIKDRERMSDKTAMAVIPRDVLAQLCAPHLDRGEGVRGCVEATVVDVTGRVDAAGDIGRVVVVLTERRLVTLVWRASADPEPDGAVPLEMLGHSHVEDSPIGVTLTIGLSTGPVVRFAIGPAHAGEARALAAAISRDSGVTEEIPVVGAVAPKLSPEEAASRLALAAELARLCERDDDRILELVPGVVVTRSDDSASTYFVHVAPPPLIQGACPRCQHPTRDGAVFCDACGALL